MARTTKVKPSPKPAPEERRWRISDDLIARARIRPQSAWRPFDPPQFPPRVTVPKGAAIAQDEALIDTGIWANQAIRSGYAEGLIWPGYAELALDAQRAEYRVVSEEIASELTREWIKITSTSEEDKTEKIKALDDAIKRFKVKKVVHKACEHDGFFGRAHIYIAACDREDREELKTSIGNGRDDASKQKISRGDLRGFKNVEPVWCYPTRYDSVDPLSDNWYKPENWFVMGKEVHRTRLLTLISREVPDLLKPAYSFGGLSMSQMLKPYVDNWLRTRQAVTDLLQSFTLWVLKTQTGTTLSGAGGDELLKRIDLFNALRNSHGLMTISQEMEEEFDNISAPLGTLDQLQAQAQEHMASCSRIPIVKLLGIQPAGLNASSEGELNSFYDWIASLQEAFLREPITTLLDFVQLNEFGEVDPDITFEFNALKQLDENEEADISVKKAQTDDTYVQMGAVSAEEVRERLAADPKSPYQGLDLDKTPPPEPPGMEELMSGEVNGRGSAAEPESRENERDLPVRRAA